MFKERKGFTLIELLVVITIIAVLAAILFPVFFMARARAREMNCLSNLKQLSGSFGMYTSDWGAYPYTAVPSSTFMYEGHATSNMPLTGNFRFRRDELWTAKISEYLGYEMIHYSPTPGGPSTAHGVAKCREQDKQWRDPNNNQLRHPGGMERDEIGYGYNFLYLGLPWRGTDGPANPYHSHFRAGSVKPGNVTIPSETVLLVENATVWAFPPFLGRTTTTCAGTMYTRPRHGGRKTSAVLWCDGHVRAVNTNELVRAGIRFGDFRTGAGSGNLDQRHWQGIATDNWLWDIKMRL